MASRPGGQELLNRKTVTAVAGDPEPAESSDPDTEDYFASSESSNSRNLHQDGNVMRMDSTTPAWPILNLARIVQTKAQRAIHPAFRTQPSTSNAGRALIAYETPSRNANLIPPNPPMRDMPIYSPADAMPPRRAPAVQSHAQMLQQKRIIGDIFNFGESGTHTFEVTAGRQHSKHDHTKRSHAPCCQLPKIKIDQLRESLSNLNVANKIKQLAGTKRSRDKTADEEHIEPALKRSNAEFHCDTCQCHAMLEDSLPRLAVRHPMDPPKRRRPPPPPPPGYIQRTRTFTVTETEVEDDMTPLSSPVLAPNRSPGRISTYQPSRSIPHEPVLTPMLRDYRQNACQDLGRSPPQRNDEALALLEGRTGRPHHQAPEDLKRADPDSLFTVKERRQLRRAIALAETGFDPQADASGQDDGSEDEFDFEEAVAF